MASILLQNPGVDPLDRPAESSTEPTTAIFHGHVVIPPQTDAASEGTVTAIRQASPVAILKSSSSGSLVDDTDASSASGPSCVPPFSILAPKRAASAETDDHGNGTGSAGSASIQPIPHCEESGGSWWSKCSSARKWVRSYLTSARDTATYYALGPLDDYIDRHEAASASASASAESGVSWAGSMAKSYGMSALRGAGSLCGCVTTFIAGIDNSPTPSSFSSTGSTDETRDNDYDDDDVEDFKQVSEARLRWDRLRKDSSATQSALWGAGFAASAALLAYSAYSAYAGSGAPALTVTDICSGSGLGSGALSEYCTGVPVYSIASTAQSAMSSIASAAPSAFLAATSAAASYFALGDAWSASATTERSTCPLLDMDEVTRRAENSSVAALASGNDFPRSSIAHHYPDQTPHAVTRRRNGGKFTLD